MEWLIMKTLLYCVGRYDDSLDPARRARRRKASKEGVLLAVAIVLVLISMGTIVALH